MEKNKTRILVECALMIAIATVLGYIPLFEMPMGGSITLCSMAPLIIASLRNGWKWGVLTGCIHGIIQMMLGMKNVLYCTTIWSMIGCVLLDYVIAFAVMGTACVFARFFANRPVGIAASTVITGLLRLFCSFLSGILIWGGYAPAGTPVWLYSLQYNASYMIPEIVITMVAVVVIMRVVEKRFPVAGV